MKFFHLRKSEMTVSFASSFVFQRLHCNTSISKSPLAIYSPPYRTNPEILFIRNYYLSLTVLPNAMWLGCCNHHRTSYRRHGGIVDRTAGCVTLVIKGASDKLHMKDLYEQYTEGTSDNQLSRSG